MNNGELYKQAFGTLHAPDTVSLTAEKGAERKTFRPGRRLVLVCACTVLALGLAVTAYARGGLILGHVFGWGIIWRSRPALMKTAKATTRCVSTRKI